MKKTLTVTKTIEVEIDDTHLTPERLAEFSSYMFELRNLDHLFKYAAEHVASYGECFVEGVGEAKDAFYRPSATIKFGILDVETEVLDDRYDYDY